MLIRAARDSDFGPIADLTNHYIKHTPIHFGYDPVTADELRKQWEGYRAKYPFVVAEVDGAFAGYAKAGIWRERTAYSWTPECGVYVQRGMQGRGIGRQLYTRLFEIMTAQGFQSVIGGITLPNEASVKLHDACGFVACGVVKRAGWKFGEWHDVGFWQKELNLGSAVAGEIRGPVY